MYEATTPSLVPRPSRLAAEACPFTRSSSIARSTSPSASTSADFASIIAAPVRSRSAFTSAAVTLISPPRLSPRQRARHSRPAAPAAAPPSPPLSPQRPKPPAARPEPRLYPSLRRQDPRPAAPEPARVLPVVSEPAAVSVPAPAALSAAPEPSPQRLFRHPQPLF